MSLKLLQLKAYFCSVTVRSLQRPLDHPRDRADWHNLTDCGPSFPHRLLLSFLSCPLSPSLSSIARLRSPTRHRQQGCSEGAAQPENGTTTRPVDLSIPFPSYLPASFSRVVTVPSFTELPGEWRWVSRRAVWTLSRLRYSTWLRAVLANGEPQSRGSTCRGGIGAKRQRLPSSARLGYESCKKKREREGENVCHVFFLFWAFWH